MKLSIIIPVLNSHEIVRRQALHFKAMPLPENVELIIVDDGSEPPIVDDTGTIDIIQTNDKRPWTQPRARNIGAREAKGDVFLFTDIDHIVPKEAIDFAFVCKYDYARFRRELAILDEHGRFTQDRDLLYAYGIPKDRGLRISCHTLSMIIKANVFRMIGGFNENIGHYPTHDDGNMKRKLKRLEADGQITKCPDNNPDERPPIYMIPNGRYAGEKDFNPFGLFHGLKR